MFVLVLLWQWEQEWPRSRPGKVCVGSRHGPSIFTLRGVRVHYQTRCVGHCLGVGAEIVALVAHFLFPIEHKPHTLVWLLYEAPIPDNRWPNLGDQDSMYCARQYFV